MILGTMAPYMHANKPLESLFTFIGSPLIALLILYFRLIISLGSV